MVTRNAIISKLGPGEGPQNFLHRGPQTGKTTTALAVPLLGKFHRVATREEQDTPDRWPRVYHAPQQTAVRRMEDSNTWGSQYLRTVQAGRVSCCPQTPEAKKVSRIGLHLPEVYTPRRVGSQILVLRLPQFLHAPTQNSRDLKELVVAIPKSEKPLGDRKSYHLISLLCVPFKILERLIYARVETIINSLLPQEQVGFRHGRSAETRSPCWYRTSRIAFQLKRRLELCSLTSQQPTTLYGIAASPASCCDYCLIDTWSTWSWRWLAIAALPLPPEIAKGAGYDISRTTSHRDLS